MQPTQLKEIRLGLGWSADRFALALGYKGSRASRQVMVYRWERGDRPIPKEVEYRLAWAGLGTSDGFDD